ncbi:MAG: 6-pyruvoyl tetrahydropterin synthase family protein [Phycisphaerales bacterium]
MYELSVKRTFCAAHAIVIAGQREPVHGHNWHATLTVAGPTLDAEGLLCDFHAVERALDAVIAPFVNADLNTTPPFDAVNPTAEHVAHHIAIATAAALVDVFRPDPGAPPRARVIAVAVTEAEGCTATYRPPAESDS